MKLIQNLTLFAFCLSFSTVFCRTFEQDAGAGLADVFLMILFQLLLMASMFTFAWFSLKLFFRDEPELLVMGVFACVQKTIALGIPMISSIYGNDPNEALYSLPLLIWFPMQSVIGALIVPKLAEFISSERKRLGARDEEQSNYMTDVEDPRDRRADRQETGSLSD
jgi:sodium/bile acid cotransporter 7